MKPAADSRIFTIDIEGIGGFTFRHYTPRDGFRIEAEYSRLTEGVVQPSPMLDLTARCMARLKVLTVEAPAAWDLNAMDPFCDEGAVERIAFVHKLLREKEAFFRSGGREDREGTGAGPGGIGGVVVPQKVQPAADGPAVS